MIQSGLNLCTIVTSELLLGPSHFTYIFTEFFFFFLNFGPLHGLRDHFPDQGLNPGWGLNLGPLQ